MSLEKFSFYKKLEPEAIKFLQKNLEAEKESIKRILKSLQNDNIIAIDDDTIRLV